MSNPTTPRPCTGYSTQVRAAHEREIRASYRFMQEAAERGEHLLADQWLRRAIYVEGLLKDKYTQDNG